MTRAKKLKKAIRSRAAKTGESYTSARRQVLEARRRRAVTPPPEPKRAAAPRAAARPRGVTSDTAVRQKTGHGLDHWFAVLDDFGARAKGHTASARHLSEAHGVPGWHCQMITVEYERFHGLRVKNQSCAGDFQVTVSRTVPGTVEQVAALFSDPRRRGRWLRAADPRLARDVAAAFKGPRAARVTVKTPEYAHLRFRCDGARVEIYINGKAGGRATVAAHNTKLAGPAAVEQQRALWGAALDGLKAQLIG
jgi:hypothetical protein